jgi:tripartite-type tricarboxylate transporter receptor subunit TctC
MNRTSTPALKPRRALLLAAALALASPLALAQSNWPTKPVTIVVPFPAGGGTDAFARPLSAHLTKTLGKQFIIDNKGGAGGTVGASWRRAPRPTATPCSWARCTTPSRRRCTRSSTTTSRPTSCPSAWCPACRR